MSNKYSYPNIFSTMKEKHKRLVMDKVIGNVDKYFKLIVIGILSIQLLVSVIALNTFNSLTIQA